MLIAGQKCLKRPFWPGKSATKCYERSFVKPCWYETRKCWRVLVPPSDSETGKRIARHFLRKEDAEQFIVSHRKTGSVALSDLSLQERHVLGLIRQAEDYSPKLLLDVWHQYQHEKHSAGRRGPGPTVSELTSKFYERQVKEKRSKRTLMDDRLRLRKFTESIGEKPAKKCASSDVIAYLESIPPGTNRRSHYKTLKKFWRWAYQLGHIDAEPMARMRPLDAWGANVEFLSVPLYSRILKVVQGLEEPAEGVPATSEYKDWLPYFVLGGLAGLRTCEMVRTAPDDPILLWEDILWNEKLIHIRNEVAKQTRARDRRRYVPLEPAVAEILRPLAGKGPIMTMCENHFYICRRELVGLMKIKLPDNCLRNSYATYAQTFRSLGDVARAMGDREETIKRFYVQTLKPGTGRNWFDPLGQRAKRKEPAKTRNARQPV